MYFTTSWDDGYALDLRVAELLRKHGLTATFYICPAQRQRALLSPEQIKTLAQNFELGAHTIMHPHLTRIPADRARDEITSSKQWVEEVSGRACTMFCYPYGDYNDAVMSFVKEAGFTGARTTNGLQFSSRHQYALPVTVQLSPFPWRKEKTKVWHHLDPLGPVRARFRRLRQMGVPLKAMSSWLSLAHSLFTDALENNAPFFHLWGHSSEIEKFNQWEDLATFLSFVRSHDQVVPVTNAGLVKNLFGGIDAEISNKNP